MHLTIIIKHHYNTRIGIVYLGVFPHKHNECILYKIINCKKEKMKNTLT